jgi:predicted TIM-barrel fold metal-dependent hydrolase
MIDVHTHPVQVAEIVERDPALANAVRDVFGLFMPAQPLATFLGHLDAAGAHSAVILPIDCTSAHGCKILSNQQIARLMELSDRLIGFASVDPAIAGAASVLQHDVHEYGLRGLKLDPALQRFLVSDEERAYPIYQACVELDIPVLVHCGMSWAPKGRASFAHPLSLEPVVKDFPDLRVIIPHFAWPWVGEAVMLALTNRNVYLDTSVLYSGSPGEALTQVVASIGGIDVIERSLREQIVFGSDYPRVDPKRVAWAVRDLGMRDSLAENVFHANAQRALKLEVPR